MFGITLIISLTCVSMIFSACGDKLPTALADCTANSTTTAVCCMLTANVATNGSAINMCVPVANADVFKVPFENTATITFNGTTSAPITTTYNCGNTTSITASINNACAPANVT